MENRYLRVFLLKEGETAHSAFFGPRVCPMKIRYFADTDKMLIQFLDAPVMETRDLDEDTILDPMHRTSRTSRSQPSDSERVRHASSTCCRTSACSDPGRHEAYEPDCISSVAISAHAPQEWRPVADAGRSVAMIGWGASVKGVQERPSIAFLHFRERNMKSKHSRVIISAAGAFYGLLLCTSATAECVVSPPVRANVKVMSCLGVTYEAPEWMSAARNKSGQQPDYYAKGSRISGTILYVEVTSNMQTLVRDKWSEVSNVFHDWPKGKRLDVFVSAPSDKACPPERNITAMVQSVQYCCDTWPRAGLCMLPGSVTPVSIIFAAR